MTANLGVLSHFFSVTLLVHRNFVDHGPNFLKPGPRAEIDSYHQEESFKLINDLFRVLFGLEKNYLLNQVFGRFLI